MIVTTPPYAATSIPVIDLEDSFSSDLARRRTVAAAIHRAARENGFFYAANHRVSKALIEAQFGWARRFFALPLGLKLDIHMRKSASTAGYEPMGGQRLDSQDTNAPAAPADLPGDLKEAFYCGLDLPDDHDLAQKRWRIFGHNQWPQNLPGFREQTLAYHAAMQALGDHVLSLIALSLDLGEDWFRPFFDMPAATLRLVRYPPQGPGVQSGQWGAGAHTDWGGVTLLAQDGAGGLEVRNAGGDWIEARPIENAFVVNFGDLMTRWTNGLYNSNMHRVKNVKSGGDRYSIPFFYSPRPDAVIEPITTCVSDDRPRRFPACTAAEHTDEMFRRSYGYVPAA